MSQAVVCPHCGAAVTTPQSLCPNCGIVLPSVWPPPPTAGEPTLPPRPTTLTGRVWTDFLLGAAVQYLAHLATARVMVRILPWPNPIVPQHGEEASEIFSLVAGEIFWASVLGLVIYFALWRFFPGVARGSGYATLALLAVLLGALFTCQPVTY